MVKYLKYTYPELKTEETYLGKSIDKELKDEIGKFIKL